MHMPWPNSDEHGLLKFEVVPIVVTAADASYKYDEVSIYTHLSVFIVHGISCRMSSSGVKCRPRLHELAHCLVIAIDH